MPLDTQNPHVGPDSDDPFRSHDAAPSPIIFGVGERKLHWEASDGQLYRVPSHKAIIRAVNDQPHVLAVVGSEYRLVHNKELFAHVQDTMRKEIQGHDLTGVQIVDRVSGWGRICYRQYVFPNIMCTLTGNVRSQVAFRLIVQNGYGGSALRVHAGAIDFYCTNGMISGEYQSAYRKHTKGLMISGFGATIRNSLEAFNKGSATWEKWARTPVRHQAAMDLFRDLASSDKLRENLSQQYLRERDARGDNLWSVYSAMTYYASHHDGEFALRKTVQEQDTVASTMLARELNVARWIETPQWHALETT